jgi:hypothetical protein
VPHDILVTVVPIGDGQRAAGGCRTRCTSPTSPIARRIHARWQSAQRRSFTRAGVRSLRSLARGSSLASVERTVGTIIVTPLVRDRIRTDTRSDDVKRTVEFAAPDPLVTNRHRRDRAVTVSCPEHDDPRLRRVLRVRVGRPRERLRASRELPALAGS